MMIMMIMMIKMYMMNIMIMMIMMYMMNIMIMIDMMINLGMIVKMIGAKTNVRGSRSAWHCVYIGHPPHLILHYAKSLARMEFSAFHFVTSIS